MNPNIFSALGLFASSDIPMVILLAKATIILLLALGVTIVMQRASAGARHLVWLVAVAALLFVPVLTAWGPLPLRVLPAPSSTADRSSSIVGSKSQEARTTEGHKAAPIAPGSAKIVTPRANGIPATVSESGLKTGISILFLIWAAVVVAITASLVYAALAVRRIVNRARPLDTADWLNPLWEVSDRLSLDQPPRLLRSDDAKMPFACGLFTPTIVLPAECDSWSLDRRRAVLLHELAHVRRHDLVGHTLGRLACAVYWFHPLVWTAAKRLRSESERACDDLALACGARAADYAEHLLDIVTSVRRDSTPSVALAMARRKEFEGRMLAILDPELRHSSPSRRQSATLIGSLALIAIVVGAAAPAPRASRNPTASVKEFESSPIVVEKDHSGSYQFIDGSRTQVSTLTATSKSEHASISVSVGGTTTRAGLLEVLRQGGKKGIAQDDERPVLLAKVLSTDTSASLRRIAAWGLAEYAHVEVAADALSNALRHDSNPRVREMAGWALASANRSSAASDALSAALRGDADVRVRVISAWSLGSIGDRSAIGALSAALSDASPEVRKRALWAIGDLGPKQIPLDAIIALLADRDPEVRELAAWSLYQIQDPAAIPALEGALRAEKANKGLQIAYIRALAATGEKSVDALKGLLESPDPEIKSIAVRALAGGNATGPWPWPWPEPRPFPE